MKQWSSQWFPVVLLGLLAGLSFILMHAIEIPDLRGDGKDRHDPDAIAENFIIQRYDAEGKLRYRLVAPHMQHFPDDDSSLITTPTLTNFRPNGTQLVIRSEAAEVTAKGTVAHLWNDVVARRPATADRTEIVATMPDLTVHTEDGTAFTNNPVEIRQGASWIRGTGMNLDNRTSTFVLHSQVTGTYYRPNATP